MKKVESGVMLMKEGLAWGVTYEDGQSTAYGWMNPADSGAMVMDPSYCKRVTDATYKGSYLIPELKKGKLVHVERVTEVFVTSKE